MTAHLTPRTLIAVVVGFAAALACQLPAAGAAELSAGRIVTPDYAAIGRYALLSNASGTRSALLYDEVARRGGHPDNWRLVVRVGHGRALGHRHVLERVGIGFAADGIEQERLAIGSDGSVAVAWLAQLSARESVIRVAIAPPNHGFGSPRTIVRSSSLELGGVAVDARGRAIVTWSSESQCVAHAAFQGPAGRFGARQTLGSCDDHAPKLATAPSGEVLAVWRAGIIVAGTTTFQVAAARARPGASRFAWPATLSDEPSNPRWWDVTSGPGGAAVSYVARLGAGAQSRSVVRIARVGRRDRPLRPTTALPALAGQTIGRPALAIPARGAIVAAWNTDSAYVLGLFVTSADAVGPPRMLGGASARSPAAGALADRVLVAWAENATPGVERLRLAVRVRGLWKPTVTVATGRAITDVAVTSWRRGAMLSWMQRDSGHGRRLRIAAYRLQPR